MSSKTAHLEPQQRTSSLKETLAAKSLSVTEINGVSLLTRKKEFCRRYSFKARLKILGATEHDFNQFVELFCPDRPLYARTRSDTDDPRAWYTPKGRISDTLIADHLLGDLLPHRHPTWVAPRSWEVTRWIGIDIDFRGDRDDYCKRVHEAISRLLHLGISRRSILKSKTPSGGTHLRFILDRKVRVQQVAFYMRLAGFIEQPGKIEIFPRMDRGMRLPFGYIPGTRHDPRRFISFIRRMRHGRIPLVNFDGLTEVICHLGNRTGATCFNPPPAYERPKAPRVGLRKVLNRLDEKRGSQTDLSDDFNRVARLSNRDASCVKRPRKQGNRDEPKITPAVIASIREAGIPEFGTRLRIIKTLAWHALFVQRMPSEYVKQDLIDFSYSRGKHTSRDVMKDLQAGTRKVEKQIHKYVDWLVLNYAPVMPTTSSHLSKVELRSVLAYFDQGSHSLNVIRVAFHILRYAKLHGEQGNGEWIVPLAINGVVRKWPGCQKMGYKPILDTLKAVGFLKLVREKVQSSNKTGKARVYAVKISPSESSVCRFTADRCTGIVARLWKFQDQTRTREIEASSKLTNSDLVNQNQLFEELSRIDNAVPESAGSQGSVNTESDCDTPEKRLDRLRIKFDALCKILKADTDRRQKKYTYRLSNSTSFREEEEKNLEEAEQTLREVPWTVPRWMWTALKKLQQERLATRELEKPATQPAVPSTKVKEPSLEYRCEHLLSIGIYMAHNLATTDNRPALAYFGVEPWHRLGTKLDNPATSAEAIQAAGLDYEARLERLQTVDGHPVPQRKAVVRSDDRAVLGVVGNSYVPVQNRQAFDFLDTLAGDGSIRYHTAGALGKGEKIWMLAKLPNTTRIKDSADVTEQFLLLSNSHDGRSALRVFFTPIRVVCANTLGAAERRGRGQGVSIMHKGNLNQKVQEAQAILGLASRFYDSFDTHANRMANVYPSKTQLEEYFDKLYPDVPDAKRNRAQSVRQELIRLFESGKGQEIPEIRSSLWAAFNAVTEYVDHYRSTRGRTDTERLSRRLESAWFGSGASLKARAWNEALHLAG